MNKISKKPSSDHSGPFVLGRATMEKISAVEGIVFPDDMKRQFDEYDRQGLSHDERERLIVQKYGKRR